MTVTLETAPNASHAIQNEHALALQQSLDQEMLGYSPEVEVSRDVTMPRAVGMEGMAIMGIQRRLNRRELKAHSSDETLMVITTSRNKVYL